MNNGMKNHTDTHEKKNEKLLATIANILEWNNW